MEVKEDLEQKCISVQPFPIFSMFDRYFPLMCGPFSLKERRKTLIKISQLFWLLELSLFLCVKDEQMAGKAENKTLK